MQSKFLTCTLSALFFWSFPLLAQQETKPRVSPKASVNQRIGVDTDITIQYGRPGVKGRKIWGKLVPYGMDKGNQYSDNKPIPWRGVANECTAIELISIAFYGVKYC